MEPGPSTGQDTTSEGKNTQAPSIIKVEKIEENPSEGKSKTQFYIDSFTDKLLIVVDLLSDNEDDVVGGTGQIPLTQFDPQPKES